MKIYILLKACQKVKYARARTAEILGRLESNQAPARPLSVDGRLYVEGFSPDCRETLGRKLSHAAILADDVQWLFYEPPAVKIPRLFYPERAPESPWDQSEQSN